VRKATHREEVTGVYEGVTETAFLNPIPKPRDEAGKVGGSAAQVISTISGARLVTEKGPVVA